MNDVFVGLKFLQETLWAISKKAHEMKCSTIIMNEISMVMIIFLFLGTSVLEAEAIFEN